MNKYTDNLRFLFISLLHFVFFHQILFITSNNNIKIHIPRKYIINFVVRISHVYATTFNNSNKKLNPSFFLKQNLKFGRGLLPKKMGLLVSQLVDKVILLNPKSQPISLQIKRKVGVISIFHHAQPQNYSNKVV